MGEFVGSEDAECQGTVCYKFDPADGDAHVTVEFAFTGSTPEVESDKALAVLIIEEVVVVHSNWWRTEMSDEQKKATSVSVNCSDVFAYACADAENLPYRDIENLYLMWKADRVYGPTAWSILHRNRKPTSRVAEAIGARGLWKLDEWNLGATRTVEEIEALTRKVARESVPASDAGGAATEAGIG